MSRTFGIAGEIVISSGTSLAPDTNYIANLTVPGDEISTYLITGNLDGTSGLVTAISLSGKFALYSLQIDNNLSEAYTLKLTVDGIVIWNSSKTLPIRSSILGSISVSIDKLGYESPITCKSSILLEVSSASDASFRFNYLARPLI